MNLKTYFLLCLIAIPEIAFCQKNNIHTASVLKSKTDVYVAGYVKAANGKLVAAYWKNGVCTKLSDGKTHCIATGIAVKDTDVYVSGNYEPGDDIRIPTYWKNGVEKKLIDSNFYAQASGIGVDANGDIYVAGFIVDANNTPTAVYWKNGHKATMLAPNVSSLVNAVAINETGVYFAGNVTPSGNKAQAVYWKDGMLTNMSKDTAINSSATAIALNGADVYILLEKGKILSFSTHFAIVCSKNNDEAITVKDNIFDHIVGAIAVNNNHDVYCANFSNMDHLATYQKNNDTPVNLTNGNFATALTLTEDDVYVAGMTMDGKVAYWENGIINYLPGGEAASGIVVVTH